MESGRAASIDEMLASDAVVHGLGPSLRGPSEFKPFQALYRSAFPDIDIQVDDVLAEGDLVAARWSGVGTHRGDGLGFRATSKRAQFKGLVILRVRDGKIVEGWNSFDQLGMLQQLGVVTLPGS
ncbi:MAG TPA: ester cyclase [Vicinamibacterales bacterium]